MYKARCLFLTNDKRIIFPFYRALVKVLCPCTFNTRKSGIPSKLCKNTNLFQRFQFPLTIIWLPQIDSLQVLEIFKNNLPGESLRIEYLIKLMAIIRIPDLMSRKFLAYSRKPPKKPLLELNIYLRTLILMAREEWHFWLPDNASGIFISKMLCGCILSISISAAKE